MPNAIGSDTALLREWDLLQDQVVPRLLDIDEPTVWSVGSAEDAVAVAVAYNHASAPADSIEVFASSVPSALNPVTFSLADIRCVPADSRAYFAREDQRFVPDAAISEQVMLAEPTGGVDLLTVRIDGDDTEVTDDMVDQLNEGGCLLVVSAPEAVVAGLPDLQPVDGENRIFRKRAQRRARRHQAGPTGKQETLACHQMRAGLVHSHMGLARSLARRFARHGQLQDDLDQVASMALVKAAQRFDPSLEAAFSSYAAASITGELKRHFRDKAWTLRVPRSVKELYLAVRHAREELSHQLGATPTSMQIAAYLEVEESAVLDALRAGDSYAPASLDARVSPEGDSVEVPVLDTTLARALDYDDIKQAVARLDETERIIVRRLFFDEWTQRQVAEEIGVSQMQVSRILARTLVKLRMWIDDE